MGKIDFVLGKVLPDTTDYNSVVCVAAGTDFTLQFEDFCTSIWT